MSPNSDVGPTAPPSPRAYPESSATAMIATAMLRGIRNGWIDRVTYEPLVQKAWKAILARTGSDGRLVDVCESTGTRGLTAEDTSAARRSSAATIAAGGWPCFSRRNWPAYRPRLQDRIKLLRS
jgi:hypothetical protein